MVSYGQKLKYNRFACEDKTHKTADIHAWAPASFASQPPLFHTQIHASCSNSHAAVLWEKQPLFLQLTALIPGVFLSTPPTHWTAWLALCLPCSWAALTSSRSVASALRGRILLPATTARMRFISLLLYGHFLLYDRVFIFFIIEGCGLMFHLFCGYTWPSNLCLTLRTSLLKSKGIQKQVFFLAHEILTKVECDQ